MFLTKRPNGIYSLVIKLQDQASGQHRRKFISTGTRIKAEAYKFQRSFSLESIRSKLPKASALSAFIQEYTVFSKTIHKPSTVETELASLRELLRIIGEVQLSEINLRHVEKFFSVKNESCSKHSLRRHYVTLRSIFQSALKWEYVKHNPFDKYEKPKSPELQPCYFSQQEFTHLLSVITDHDFKELVIFALLTGMRQGEIRNLHWNQVDMEKGVIFVRNEGGFTTKSERNRTLPINQDLLKMLKLKKQGAGGEELLFNKSGNPYRKDFISQRFKSYVRRAKLDDRLHFHSLRHTFASWLVEDGASLYEVQKLLGHSDQRTSMIYAHLQPERLHSTVNKISIAFAKREF